MPPEQNPLWLILAWSGAAVLLLSVFLPPLLHLLGLSSYRSVIEEQPTDLEPDDADQLYADLVGQLRALGFRPLGAFTERVHFFALHWLWTCRQRVFHAPAQGAYAVFYRFTPDEPVRMAFATCCTDEALLWTGNHSESIQQLHADHVRWGKATSDMAELLGLHHEAAAKFAEGRTVSSHDDLAFLAAVVGRHSQRVIHGDKSLPVIFLGLPLLLGGLLPLAMGWQFGWTSVAVPIACAVEVALYWLVHTREIIATVKRDRQYEIRQGRSRFPAPCRDRSQD